MPRGLRRVAAGVLRNLFFMLLFCILTYTPFTNTHVIQAGIIPALADVHALHQWLHLGASALVFATLWPDLRKTSSRGLRVVTAAYVLGLVASGIYLLEHPVLATLTSDDWALRWGLLVALAPSFSWRLSIMSPRGGGLPGTGRRHGKTAPSSSAMPPASA